MGASGTSLDIQLCSTWRFLLLPLSKAQVASLYFGNEFKASFQTKGPIGTKFSMENEVDEFFRVCPSSASAPKRDVVISLPNPAFYFQIFLKIFYFNFNAFYSQ